LVDRLLKVYEESLQRVLPLKQQLAKTDRLIDAVVYRLYGLTEEEIKIVEGKT
jgi:type II restriction/modification system DNA methylase subunit YeeA